MPNHDLSAVEDTVSELQLLSKRQPLKDEDLLRAKDLMASLKEAGYTNKEISILTGDKWSEPTVKLYTRGTNTKDSTPKDNASKVISEMISKGLSFDQVIQATGIKSEIDKAEGNITVKDLLNLVEKAKKSNRDISEVIELFNKLNAESRLSSLLFNQLSDLLYYKSELETKGITIEHLKQILQLCKSYIPITTTANTKVGQEEHYKANAENEANTLQSEKNDENKMTEKIMESVSTYGSIINLKSDLNNLELQKDKLGKEINLLSEDIKQIEGKKLEIGTPLKAYEDLSKVITGFGNGIVLVNKLQHFCNTHHIHNTTELLELVDTYGNLIDIKKEIKELVDKRKEAETNTREAESKYAHLMTVIGMCNTLLFDYKFSVSAIQNIYKIAEKYKEPFKVLQAISLYRNSEDIEEENTNLESYKRELQSQVKELNEQLLDITGKIKATKICMDGILTTASSEISKAFNSSMTAITNTYQQQISIIKKESQEYGIRAGQAKILEEELNWARMIFSILKFPSEAKNLPSDFALVLLDAVTRFCNAKSINPTISVRESLISTERMLGEYSQIPALNLINGAKKALDKVIAVQ
jgi:ribosome-binding protein aMBF1 (putative translation factor)